MRDEQASEADFPILSPGIIVKGVFVRLAEGTKHLN